MRSKSLSFCVVIFVFLVGICLAAKAAAADLVVEVVDSSGGPIIGAAVNVTGKRFSKQSITDEAGYASLHGVPSILLTISVEHDGIFSGNSVADMRPGDSREVKIVLSRMVGLDELLELPSP